MKEQIRSFEEIRDEIELIQYKLMRLENDSSKSNSLLRGISLLEARLEALRWVLGHTDG